MKTTAHVYLEILVECTGAWEKNCSAQQVAQQATQSAKDLVEAKLRGESMKIIGSPKVKMIISEIE